MTVRELEEKRKQALADFYEARKYVDTQNALFFRLCTEGSLPTALLGQSQQAEQSVAACEEAAEIVSFINIRLVNIYTQLEKVVGTAQVRDYLVAAMIQTKIWEDDTIKRATIFDEMFTSHEVVYEMRKEDFDAGNS